MRSQNKTKRQVINELTKLRGRIVKLETVELEHKRLEQMLRYQADLLKNISDAIICTTLEFKIRKWNKAAEIMYGWETHEVSDKPLDEITKLQYRGDWREEVLKELFEKGYWKGEIVQKEKNKTTLCVLSSISLFEGPWGNPVGTIMINHDITERKQAEKILQESAKKYKSLTENINVGVYRNTTGPKGKFIEVNPAIIEMFGYESREKFLAINVADLYRNPDDRLKFNEKMLSESFVRNEELQLKKK